MISITLPIRPRNKIAVITKDVSPLLAGGFDFDDPAETIRNQHNKISMDGSEEIALEPPFLETFVTVSKNANPSRRLVKK